MAAAAIALKHDFSPALETLLKETRYKVLYGGRGGAKSWDVARLLILIACYAAPNNPIAGFSGPVRILCAREFQKSIAESVHRLLEEQIGMLGLGACFYIGKTSIVSQNGSEFIFEGLKMNVNKIKSLEGIDIAWVEEAEMVSAYSWSILTPTIRKAGSQIWVTFNPREEDDPTFDMFITHAADYGDELSILKVGHEDNPWFEFTNLVKDMERAYRVDPEAADHIWGGNIRKITGAQIFGPTKHKQPDGTFKYTPKYRVDQFTVGVGWTGPYFGVDWGFANDPATMVKCWAYDHKLYIEHEAYAVGVELPQLKQLFQSVPGSILYRKLKNGDIVACEMQPAIRADNSRPETIVYMAESGFNIGPAKKWPGSVEDGIVALRSFEEIIIHPRCKHAQEEARLYSYKIDPITNDVLPIVVDKHNHIWDAIRYALEPWISMMATEIVTASAPKAPIAADLDQVDNEEVLVGWSPSGW